MDDVEVRKKETKLTKRKTKKRANRKFLLVLKSNKERNVENKEGTKEEREN